MPKTLAEIERKFWEKFPVNRGGISVSNEEALLINRAKDFLIATIKDLAAGSLEAVDSVQLCDDSNHLLIPKGENGKPLYEKELDKVAFFRETRVAFKADRMLTDGAFNKGHNAARSKLKEFWAGVLGE